MGFTDAVEPILRVLPEVPKPTRRPSLTERFAWTAVALVLYMAMAHTPIYGIPWQAPGYERFMVYRVITASRRGTLMELGIGPLVTSGLIWQLLVGSKIVDIDITTRRGRAIFSGIQKLFAIVFTIVQALAFILGGVYGTLSPSTAVLVFLQLSIATFIVLLLDEMLQKGWGIGSGISLFIAAGVSQDIFWRMFSPIEVQGLPLGAIPAIAVAVFQGITTGSWDKIQSIALRAGYPDLLGLTSTFAFFIALMYLENIRIDIPIGVSKYGGIRSSIPLKFLYVSNIPIILVSALYANVHIFSQLIWLRIDKKDWMYENILKYIFNYNKTGEGQLIPLKGTLVYYLSPPGSYVSVMEDPLHFLVYSLLFIGLCILFSIIWIQTAGMDPWSQARQLAEAGIYVPGFRRAPKIIASILSRYVPTLAILSGLLVALIAVTSDIIGVFGGGIGILLLVGILAQYQALIARERAIEMYPLLRRLTGVR